MHSARQSVLLHQSFHTESEAQCYSHRKSLRHGHHDERYGNHYRIQCVLNKNGPVCCSRCAFSKVNDDADDGKYHKGEHLPQLHTLLVVIVLLFVEDEVDDSSQYERHTETSAQSSIVRVGKHNGMTNQTAEDNQYGKTITCLGDKSGKFIKLFTKWCCFAISHLRRLEHLTASSSISHSKHTGYAVTLHNRTTFHDMVGRIGGIFVKLRRIDGLATLRFASE